MKTLRLGETGTSSTKAYSYNPMLICSFVLLPGPLFGDLVHYMVMRQIKWLVKAFMMSPSRLPDHQPVFTRRQEASCLSYLPVSEASLTPEGLCQWPQFAPFPFQPQIVSFPSHHEQWLRMPQWLQRQSLPKAGSTKKAVHLLKPYLVLLCTGQQFEHNFLPRKIKFKLLCIPFKAVWGLMLTCHW